jgi:hypothetical protein
LVLPLAAAAASASPEALDRDADLYLVPFGDLPEALLSGLAGYYEDVLRLRAAVTGPLPFDPAMWNDDRKQFIAEELLLGMARGFRGWARNPRALFVAITDRDIYSNQTTWRFAFAVRRGNHLAVVSGARMLGLLDRPGTWPLRRVARLRKMVTKTIALQYLRLPLSPDPASVLYGRVLGPADLDRIDEATLRRDVIEPSRGRGGREAAEDSEDLLSLRSPIALPGEADRKDKTAIVLVLGGIGLYVALLGFHAVWTRRRAKSAWRAVAMRHGWRFVEADGPWYKRGSWRIKLEVDGVSAVADRVQVGSYRSRIEWTRIRADVSCPRDFRIVPESFFTRIMRRLARLTEVETGDPTYDRAYVVMCEDGEWLRSHLPKELRDRQLASKAILFCEKGVLELRRVLVADDEGELLALIQVFVDAAAAIRERPSVAVAPSPIPVLRSPLPGGGSSSRVYARRALRLLLAVAAIELLGALPLQITIQTEQTGAFWRISLPFAGALTLASVLCLLMSGNLSARMPPHSIVGVLLLVPIIFFWYWILSGPWVLGWNAMVGRPHAEGLWGPVIEKRSARRGRGTVLLPHPDEDRMVRIRVAPSLLETVRPGDPVRLNVRQGGLGFFYWYRE